MGSDSKSAEAVPLTALGRLVRIVMLAIQRFSETNASERAAAFAYYAFFAIFPLLLIFVTIGSLFFDYTETATKVMDAVGGYVPSISEDSDGRNSVLAVVQTVVASRRSAGIIAFLVVVWSALGFFQALVRGVNRAWGTKEYAWWRLPIQNLLMLAVLGTALLLGMVAPPVLDAVQALVNHEALNFQLVGALFWLAHTLIPLAVTVYGFVMFYKFAPRQHPTFREVWIQALLVALALQVLQRMFVLYASNFHNFNQVYGALGGVLALLMWIYLSGSVIIFGGCLCAAAAEVKKGRDAQKP
ncbi:MAG: YihY/virulence factor BrkB family protein [Chthoniobacteraceae bacterium]